MANENSSTSEAVHDTGAQDKLTETITRRFGDGAVAAKQAVGTAVGFVQDQPWLAVAGAFVLGYVTAQLVKRMD